MSDKAPPNDLQAEMAAIGAMLVDREMIPLVFEHLRPADFYAVVHERIAQIVLDLHAAGRPVDKISLAEVMRTQGVLEKFGGLSYLTSLLDTVPTAASAIYYASLVAEKAQLRRLIFAGLKIQAIGFEGEANVEAAIGDADRELRDAIALNQLAMGGVSMQDAMRDVFSELSDAVDGISESRAIQTPWPAVNALVGGFFPEELVVIASAPAQGKTGLVLNLADYIGSRYGHVAFFSLEMSPRAIAQRWLALHSGLSARNQRLGNVRDDDWERIDRAMSTIARRGVTLFGRQCASIESMRREIARLAREHTVKAIVIDHVNFLADVDSTRNVKMTKHEKLDSAYRRLIQIGAEFKLVTFAVQHVNRAGSTGQRPTITNIRDGGNPEGHAHAILLPYRENPSSNDPRERMVGELIVAKSRDGEEGIVPLEFQGWRHLWIEEGQRPWFELEEAS